MTETVYTLAEAYEEFVEPELRQDIDKAIRRRNSLPTIRIIRPGEPSGESRSHAQGEVDRLVRRATAQIVSKLKSGELLMRAYPADRPYQGEPITFPKVAWTGVVIFRWRNNKISLGGTEFSGVQMVDGAEPLKRDASLSTNRLGRKSTRETSLRIFGGLVAQGPLENSLAAQARQVLLNYPDGKEKPGLNTVEGHIRENYWTEKEAKKLPDKDDT